MNIGYSVANDDFDDDDDDDDDTYENFYCGSYDTILLMVQYSKIVAMVELISNIPTDV